MKFALVIIGACAAVTVAALAGAAQVRSPDPSEVQRVQDGPALDLSGMRMTFSEEFDAFQPRYDGGRWQTHYWFGGPQEVGGRTLKDNRELELYVDPQLKSLGLNPFSTENGVLTITANPTPAALKSQLWGFAYTSGVINTEGVFSQRYGYFEMRAKLPKGKGLWPAFWLCAEDRSWPPELDVMEMIGSQPGTYFTTVHNKEAGKTHSRSLAIDLSDLSTDFHTYGLKWTATDLEWYFDGKLVSRAPTPPGVDKPMHLIANLAVGGNWPGPPNATTPFPARMAIDYIRVYALS